MSLYVRNENIGPMQMPNMAQTQSKNQQQKSRGGLVDITNTEPNSPPVQHMNLSLLAKRAAQVPTATGATGQAAIRSTLGYTAKTEISPSSVNLDRAEKSPPRFRGGLGVGHGRGSPTRTSTSHARTPVSSNAHLMSPMHMVFSTMPSRPPLDDFTGMGVNPSSYMHMQATRQAVLSSGALNNSRASMSFERTDCAQFNLERLRAAKTVVTVPTIIKSAIVSPLILPDEEWYAASPSPSLSPLLAACHAITEESSLADKLSALQKSNLELENALAIARRRCSQVDQVGEINDRMSEVAQQLKEEVDAKESEIRNLRSLMASHKSELESLRESTDAMGKMNTTLNEELVMAHELLDDLRDTEGGGGGGASNGMSVFSSPATCKSHESIHFDTLPLEDQKRIQAELLMDLEGRGQLKTGCSQINESGYGSGSVAGLESEVQALRQQLATQAELLASNQQHIADLERSRAKDASSGIAAQQEQHRRLAEMHADLLSRADALQEKEACIKKMQAELQDKDDELMTLLQSSIQSSELAAGKLSRVEMLLADKTASLISANQVNASYLRRQAEYENKEKELMLKQESNTEEIIRLQQKLHQSQAEAAQLQMHITGMEAEAKASGKKVHELETSLKSASDQQTTKSIEYKGKELEYATTRKGLLAAKTTIAELEETVRALRLAVAQANSVNARSPMYPQSASPFTAATPNGQNLSGISTRNSTPHPHLQGAAAAANTPLSSTIGLLESQVLSLEQRCTETAAENTKLQERYESSQRQLESLTDEWQRSRASLERQLKMRSQSESELASKVCGLNEQLEQLMNYSMRLTGELAKSKETEAQLANQLRLFDEEITLLRKDLAEECNPERKKQTLLIITEKEQEVAELKAKAATLEKDLARATELLTKAKLSKIRRYNKYVSLQQDYRLVVAQGERAASENMDLKQRHKVFVKTVEAALLGGEGKIALDRFKDKDTPTDSQNANNRSLLNLSQELGAFDYIPNPDFSDADENDDEDDDDDDNEMPSRD